ncbi:MAG: prepilin-type N-terminal cleavage/methylation domain-containing protein [Vicinamibacterales bacterium]
MTDFMQPTTCRRLASSAGYSLVELLIAMTLLTLIMGATLGGLANVMTGNETVMMLSTMNGQLRSGLDLMVRDFLQVGSGLPASHSVSIPNGAGSVTVRLPGPPGTAFTTTAGDLTLPAVIPWAGGGPTIAGTATDVVSVLMADNAFLDVALSAVTNTTVTIAAGPNLATGPDRVLEGQLMLISKGSFNTLVQVTLKDVNTRVLTFANGDSLRLNQTAAAAGNLTALNAQAPVNSAAATRISRLRLITYYLDTSVSTVHPRLMRRINNGDQVTFNNNLGTSVAMDIVNLQLAYDISNGAGNPGNVEMVAADMTTAGACNPAACAQTQIRKVNMQLTAQTQNLGQASQTAFLRNTLSSQVSLRSMAFVDRYR